MTRIIRVETCDRCPHAYGSRGCRHPEALVDIDGVQTLRLFEDFFVIPAWCPLEQDGPDWRPPVTIDLHGPPRYARSTTAGGHAGESPYRHDPAARLQLSYAFQPPDPDRIARAYPPRDRCAWSPEIARKRTREIDSLLHGRARLCRSCGCETQSIDICPACADAMREERAAALEEQCHIHQVKRVEDLPFGVLRRIHQEWG